MARRAALEQEASRSRRKNICQFSADMVPCLWMKPRGKKLSEAGRLLSLSRTRFRGKPRRMYPCPYCANEFSAAEFRRHLPRCPQGISNPAGVRDRAQPSGFWQPQPLEALARQQGVAPVTRLEELDRLWPAGVDPDRLLAFVVSERRARGR